MIHVIGISKTYYSKKGVPCKAIDNLTLKLPDCGMVFILGKSGCGKTTLLNLLGGLDVVDEGRIELENGNVLDTEEKLSQYRNHDVGFVFQDYNLLESLTVAENIALGLQLQGIAEVKPKIEQSLREVGLENVEEKYPAELSGGQKQRVAIARALVKNSKIILADEPTGNLDNAAGTEIFNLLKKISTEKLVVVVSHDRENAEKYADRIIEIADGRLVRDTGDGQYEKAKNEQENYSRANLPFRLALKLGVENILQRKTKTIMTIIISFLTIFAMTMSQVLMGSNCETALAKTFIRNDVSQIALYDSAYDIPANANPDSGKRINLQVDNYLNAENLKYLKGNGYDEQRYYIVESKDDLDSMGFSFVAFEELNDESVFLTDLYLITCIESGLWEIEEGGEWTPLTQDFSFDKIIGKNIKTSDGGAWRSWKVGGIIASGYETFYAGDGALYQEMRAPYTDEKLYFEDQRYFQLYWAKAIFCTQEYANEHFASTSVKCNEENGLESSFTVNGKNMPIENVGISANLNVWTTIYQDGFVGNRELKENEIIISNDLYNELFDSNVAYGNCVGEDGEVLRIPECIGQKISFTVRQTELDKLIHEYKDFTIVGVYLSLGSGEVKLFDTWVHPDDFEVLRGYAHDNNAILLDITDVSEKTLVSVLQYLREEYTMIVDSSYSSAIYSNEQLHQNLGRTFLIFGVVLSIVTILVVIHLISFGIMSQKREIGILRAIGARPKDISRIYLVSAAVISVITFILSTLLLVVVVYINNQTISKLTVSNTVFLYLNSWSFLLLFIASVVLVFIAALIPLRKIYKMKPVDVIRNL